MPHWSFITKFSKSLLERIVFFEKKALFRKKFCFLSPQICTPSHNKVKIIFSWKNTPEVFFPNYVFFYLFLCSPIDESYKSNQIFLRKTNFKENFFLQNTLFTFLSSVLCTPADNNVVQKKFIKNEFQKKYLFWKKSFFSKFLCKPIGKFYRTFPKIFSNVIFLTKKHSEECFFFI